MPPDMREWLPEGDPVWLVIESVAHLDTAGLHALRRTGGVGRAGYDPDMLLTVLIWAWAQGQRSSRVIERLCVRDVGFRVICGGSTPDHVTIARFRAQMTDVAEELFAQVLMLCARLGLGRLGVVAMDSVKISSNASLAANRSADGLRKAAAEQAVRDAARAAARAAAAAHAARDAAEDAEFGPEHRADAVPAELGERSARAARIRAALAELEAEAQAARAADDAVAARKTARAQNKTARREELVAAHRRRRDESGSAIKGKPPAEIRVEMLARNLAQARAAQQAKIDAYDRRRKGRAPAPVEEHSMVKRVRLAWERAVTETAAAQHDPEFEPVTAAAARAPKSRRRGGDPKRNITDPASRMMPLRGGGWLQGFNCQAVTSTDGLIIATTVGNNPNDATAFTTTMAAAVAAATLLDTHRPDRAQPFAPQPNSAGIGILLADTGYLSHHNLTATGPDRLIAIGKTRAVDKAATQTPAQGPPPPESTPLQAMAHRLRTPEGHALYKQRSHIAETPFGHAKHNLGFRRFTSRGLARATAEFSFHALVHNLIKAINTGRLTPATC